MATSCEDDVQSGSECGLNCGLACGNRCALGEVCGVDEECETGFSNGYTCVASHCEDFKVSGDESGVDCGGSSCAPCIVGDLCRIDDDCESQACSVDGLCVSDKCSDGIQNQDETDLDCGGSSCGPCDNALGCAVDMDCKSQQCQADNTCYTPSCEDGVLSVDEVGVDCGGACARRCPAGTLCTDSVDCESSLCNRGVCEESMCADGAKNFSETDVDCGGGACPGCTIGQACTIDDDCAEANCFCEGNSGACTGNTGRCGGVKLVLYSPGDLSLPANPETFFAPVGCNKIHIQAWGAAGGAARLPQPVAPYYSVPGGSGGFIRGTLDLYGGERLEAWLGRGGTDFPSDSEGSWYGEHPAHGGKRDEFFMSGNGQIVEGDGGSGGGLTSFVIRGSSGADPIRRAAVPGGGGSSSVFTAPGSTANAQPKDPLPDTLPEWYSRFGGNADYGSNMPGGGAGEPGGPPGRPGVYGTLPAGFQIVDGGGHLPAATTTVDYALCQEARGPNDPPVGSGQLGSGGNGCVVVRCMP